MLGRRAQSAGTTSFSSDPSTTMGSGPYQICTSCIMNTTDPSITFDDHGVCDHCQNYYENILPDWHIDERGWQVLEEAVKRIKQAGAGRPHDCLIGISGGVNSSFLTYVAKERLGLRPLLFHVDAGWNSQMAVNNIERLVDKLGLDLLAISEFPKWRKYLISLSFRDKSSVRAVQVGGFEANIVVHRSTAVRGRGGPPPPWESSCRTRTGPVEADGAVDAQNAPTEPWKTLRVFHELPQGLSPQITHAKRRKAPKWRWETRIDPTCSRK